MAVTLSGARREGLPRFNEILGHIASQNSSYSPGSRWSSLNVALNLQLGMDHVATVLWDSLHANR